MQSSNASVKKEARCAVSGAPEWWSRKDADTRDAIDRAYGLQVSRSVGPSSRYTEQEMGDNLYVPRKTVSNADYSNRYDTSRKEFLLGRSTVNTRPSTNLGSSIRNYGLGERPTATEETDDWSEQYKICFERHADSVRRQQAASLRFPITSLPPLPVVEQQIILPGQWGEYGSEEEEEEEAGTESGGPSVFSSLWSGIRDSLRPGPRPTEGEHPTEGETAGGSARSRMPGEWDSEDDEPSDPLPSDRSRPGRASRGGPSSRRGTRHGSGRSRYTRYSGRRPGWRPPTPGPGGSRVPSPVFGDWEDTDEELEETISNSSRSRRGSNWDLYE